MINEQLFSAMQSNYAIQHPTECLFIINGERILSPTNLDLEEQVQRFLKLFPLDLILSKANQLQVGLPPNRKSYLAMYDNGMITEFFNRRTNFLVPVTYS